MQKQRQHIYTIAPWLKEHSSLYQHLRSVAANIATRAPASSEAVLGVDVSTIGQSESDLGVLGAHAVHLEVGGGSLDNVHVVYQPC